MNNPIVRAERAPFKLTPHPKHELMFYRLPSGEKRVGMSSASTVCGFNSAYLSNSSKSGSNRFKTLLGLGFTGHRVPVSVSHEIGSGATRSETLSLEDFGKFLEFAAFEVGSEQAMAIVRGLIGVSLETIARQAFGEEALTLEEIRRHLCREYAKTIDWTKEDQMDFEDIENHQIFLEAS
jgi:hypothetical protein